MTRQEIVPFRLCLWEIKSLKIKEDLKELSEAGK